MKRLTTLGLCYLFLLLTCVEVVHAAETFDEQFVGSPLLILVAVIIIAGLASLYQGIRK